MEAFFVELIDDFTSPFFLEDVGRKYHYPKDQLTDLARVAGELLPSLRQGAQWEHRIFHGEDAYGFSRKIPPVPGHEKEQAQAYSEVLMTLGEGPDQLQERYLAQEQLSECYMIESLTSELLLRGYAAYNRYLAENTDYQVAGYHFPGSGDAFPLDYLPRILADLSLPVRCNQAMYLIPKKSAAFVAELTRDKSSPCRGICGNCPRRDCSARMEADPRIRPAVLKLADIPLSYGYSRILGRS